MPDEKPRRRTTTLASESSAPTHRTPGLTEATPDETASTQRMHDQTLLSAPTPAEGDDPELHQRLRRLEGDLDALRFRVRTLERARKAASWAPTSGFWLILILVVLALSFQLSERLRH